MRRHDMFQEHELDSALQGRSQTEMRNVVRTLPEESLSLAWRSQLNERLLAVKPQRRPWWAAWQPRLAFGALGALAAIIAIQVMSPSQKPASAPGIEAALVSAHRETSGLQDVAGAGVGPYELHKVTTSDPDSELWEETELPSL